MAQQNPLAQVAQRNVGGRSTNCAPEPSRNPPGAICGKCLDLSGWILAREHLEQVPGNDFQVSLHGEPLAGPPRCDRRPLILGGLEGKIPEIKKSLDLVVLLDEAVCCCC